MMDHATFIATLVGHLAWPLTVLVVIAVIVWRGHELAKIVRSVRYGDFEVTLQKDVAEARDAAERIRVQRRIEEPETARTDKTRRLAEIDPSVAVIDEWRRLEHAIIRLIQHNGMMRFTTPPKFIDYLGSIGKLLSSEVALYNRLRSIRNSAVHLYFDQSLSTGEALEFGELVELLIGRIEEIRAEPGYITIPTPGDD